MYALINANIGAILANIAAFKRPNYHVDEYAWLLNNLGTLGATPWPNDYIDRYSNYWGVNPFGLVPAAVVRPRYFHLLQITGAHTPPSVPYAAVLRVLHGAGGNVEASFASKLCHMRTPTSPIYDRFVASFFLFAMPPVVANFDVRIRSFAAFRRFLETEYARVIAAGDLAPAIAAFRMNFAAQGAFTDQKIADSLIWGLSRMLGPVVTAAAGVPVGAGVAAAPPAPADVTIHPYLSLSLTATSKEIDRAFRKIRDEITKRNGEQIGGVPLRVRKIVFCRGPNVWPIPDWFKDWCQQNGIEIFFDDGPIAKFPIEQDDLDVPDWISDAMKTSLPPWPA